MRKVVSLTGLAWIILINKSMRSGFGWRRLWYIGLFNLNWCRSWSTKTWQRWFWTTSTRMIWALWPMRSSKRSRVRLSSLSQVSDQEAQSLYQGCRSASPYHSQETSIHSQSQRSQPRQGVQEQCQKIQANHNCLQKRIRSHHQPCPDALQLQGVTKTRNRIDDLDL